MKALNSSLERKLIYKIEAARISHMIATISYNNLYAHLREIEQSDIVPTVSQAAFCLQYSWQFIDCSFRFFCVLSKIRGLKHSDQRYKDGEKCLEKIRKIRNFLQHIDEEITQVEREIYPIVGAIMWSSSDKKNSHTLSLGTFPTGTEFHSLSYDKELGIYVGSLIFKIGKRQINLFESYRLMTLANEYLNEWLLSSGMFDFDQDLGSNFLKHDNTIKNVRSNLRYLRVKLSNPPD